MEKQIAKMCQDCMYFNPAKKECSKAPCMDVTGEIWYCPMYPNVKVMFYAVLHEKNIDFNGWEKEIQEMNEKAQNNEWYLNLRLLKKKIEAVINNKLNNKN